MKDSKIVLGMDKVYFETLLSMGSAWFSIAEAPHFGVRDSRKWARDNSCTQIASALVLFMNWDWDMGTTPYRLYSHTQETSTTVRNSQEKHKSKTVLNTKAVKNPVPS